MHKCPKVDLTDPSLVDFEPPYVNVGQMMRITITIALFLPLQKLQKPREVFSVNWKLNARTGFFQLTRQTLELELPIGNIMIIMVSNPFSNFP